MYSVGRGGGENAEYRAVGSTNKIYYSTTQPKSAHEHELTDCNGDFYCVA